jgi:hypothetical protein
MWIVTVYERMSRFVDSGCERILVAVTYSAWTVVVAAYFEVGMSRHRAVVPGRAQWAPQSDALSVARQADEDCQLGLVVSAYWLPESSREDHPIMSKQDAPDDRGAGGVCCLGRDHFAGFAGFGCG